MGTGSRLSPRPPNIEIEVDVRFLNDQVPTHDLTYGDVFMVSTFICRFPDER